MNNPNPNLPGAVVAMYESMRRLPGTAVSIRKIASEFNITPLKTRKILITAGFFASDLSIEVQKLYCGGKTIPEIQNIMKLSRASVHSYLPYERAVYNCDEASVAAVKNRRYRLRKESIEKLNAAIGRGAASDEMEGLLWSAIRAFDGYTFYTKKNFAFQYRVKGNEIFVNRKEKSITRSTVDLAFKTALQMQGAVSGPKKLDTFGASYLYPIFVRFGIICS